MKGTPPAPDTTDAFAIVRTVGLGLADVERPGPGTKPRDLAQFLRSRPYGASEEQ